MAKTCVCVKCGYHHEAETDQKSTPKHGKIKDNPFATRGREEFSALVARIEEKRQRILKRSGTDASMVRFMHSSDNKLKPIIVRAKSDIGRKSNTQDAATTSTSGELSTMEKTQDKSSLEKLGKLKLQQKFHDYLVAIVISASLMLLILEVLWQLDGAKKQ